MSTSMRNRRHRDGGFTLIELLIVITTMGMIAIAVSSAIVVILRSQATTLQRLDDNRDLLQLPIWVPQDVNSTPVGSVPGTGIEAGNLTSGCAGADAGTGLLRLTWTEKSANATTDSYRVSYRAVAVGSSVVVKRYSCVNFGTARVNNASKELALLPGGGLPITVTATSTHVVFAVTQHAGTPKQQVMQIEADSKNPAAAALPTPPPAPPPPTMALSATTVDAGTTVIATLTGFQPNEPISYYIDFTYSSDTSSGAIATTAADAAGMATTTLTVPLYTTNGTHMLFAVGDLNSFAGKALTVKNGTLVLSNGTDSTVAAGTSIVATVDGFNVGDVITFLMDDNTVLATLTYGNGNGAKGNSTNINIPLKTTGGLHIVTAKSTSGRRAVSDPPINVVPAFSLSPTSVAESFSTSAVLYGFHAGEAVTYTLDSASGAVVGSAIADINGFTKSSITIPPFTLAGTHQIVAKGDDISSAVANVNVTMSQRDFAITTTTPTVTAGGNITLSLQATINGTDDPTVNGVISITVTGATVSPNGTAPAAAPTTATFTNGVATINVNVVKAGPTTITVTDAIRTGSSPPIVVKPSSVGSITFAVACPTPISSKWTSGIVAVDLYGNLVDAATVSVTFTPEVGSNSGSISSLDWTGWTTVTVDTTYTSLTDASGKTPSFTATGPKGNAHKPSTTVTATSGGKTTSCTVTS